MSDVEKQQLREDIAQEKFDKCALRKWLCNFVCCLPRPVSDHRSAPAAACLPAAFDELDSDEKMSVGGTIGGRRGGEARKKQMAEEHGGDVHAAYSEMGQSGTKNGAQQLASPPVMPACLSDTRHLGGVTSLDCPPCCVCLETQHVVVMLPLPPPTSPGLCLLRSVQAATAPGTSTTLKRRPSTLTPTIPTSNPETEAESEP